MQPQIWHLVIISNSQSEVHICLFAIGIVNMLLTKKKGLIVADNGKQPLFTVSCWESTFHLSEKMKWLASIRAEWKILKLEFAKVWGRFWTTSQHWFQNSFRNHDRTIRLVLNQTNVFYRNTQFYNGKMAKISPKINKIEIWPKSRPKVINSQNKSHRDHILGMFEL